MVGVCGALQAHQGIACDLALNPSSVPAWLQVLSSSSSSVITKAFSAASSASSRNQASKSSALTTSVPSTRVASRCTVSTSGISS
ncbi:hypothetical protein [Ktedonobacter sp. SOSP1-85]|uniref:hypothetical protein n=1 Tax=Ktedonobacter sp. SOSP1-85 TaxID=2778367 RepID=UPI0019167416|nr:hypothetical protein [Ktedonobacter sp. SOSP1-85]